MHDTDAFEYLGKSYQIPAVKLKAGKVKDAEGSGIKKYSFGISKDNGTTWTWEGETEVEENVQEVENVEHVIAGLATGEKSLVKMQVEDRAGNKQESQTMEVTYIVGEEELKDASSDVLTAHQFGGYITPAFLSSGFCSFHIGDILYCPENTSSSSIGYYRALKDIPSNNSITFNNTDYFEYLGESYIISGGILKVNTIN